jgi:hypothetical protein
MECKKLHNCHNPCMQKRNNNQYKFGFPYLQHISKKLTLNNVSNKCFPTKCELCLEELPLYLIKDWGMPFSFVLFVYLLTSTCIIFTPNPTPPHSTPQTPILRNVFSNFLIKDYLLKCIIHCRTKRDLPYELKDFAIITFDRGNSEKVP